jgi:hypothetical protein
MHFKQLLTAALITIFAVHPASFFLVAGYSESLFLAALLGMIYWMTSHATGSTWIAASHGFILSATRVFGFPLLIIPFLMTKLSGRNIPDKRSVIVAAGTLAGFLSFLVYCQIAFGWALLYFARQTIGWGIHPDYFLILNTRGWTPFFPSLLHSSQWLLGIQSPLSAPILFWLFVVLTVIVWKMNIRDVLPITFLTTGWIRWYLASAALVTLQWRSMIRYGYPVFICAMFLCGYLIARKKHSKLTSSIFTLAWAACVIGFLILHILNIRSFADGVWIE